MKLPLLAALALLLTAPLAAAAGEEVEIVGVETPERTMANKAFDIRVELLNKGPARTVYLFAALYDGRSETTCGPATDTRFQTYTPLYQAVVQLPANAGVTWPKEGDRWGHQYRAQHVQPEPATDEFCVFVAEDDEPPRLEWLDFESIDLSTRGQNGKPTGDFTWDPLQPSAVRDVRFEATGADPDDDPVTFSWDFGHHNVSGRAKAKGEVAYHPFYPEGTYTVTLTISDGLEETLVRRDVHVAPPQTTPTGEVPVVTQSDNRTPMPFILAPLGALAAALLRRTRAPPDRSR